MRITNPKQLERFTRQVLADLGDPVTIDDLRHHSDLLDPFYLDHLYITTRSQREQVVNIVREILVWRKGLN